MKGADPLEFRHGSFASARRNQPLAGWRIAGCARRIHLRSVSAPVPRRTAMCSERAAVVASASAAVVDCDACAQSGRGPVVRTSGLGSVLPAASPLARGADAARVPATDRGPWSAPDQSTIAGAIASPARRATARGRADGRDGFAGGLRRLQKETPAFTPPPPRPGAGARSRPASVAGLLVTRNRRCGCGCPRGIRRCR